MKMVKFTEIGNVTKKQELEEIGWSVFDASVIYRSKTTLFSIADGIISVYYEYVNKDGTEYKAKAYRNFYNSIISI